MPTVIDHQDFMDPEEFEYRESFGDFLKRNREASGKTVEGISRTTRIARRYLQAFEENDIMNLPEEAFARGFLKAYAAEIGLDIDDCLARYDRFRRSLIPTQIREFKKPSKYMLLGDVEPLRAQRWLVWGLAIGVVAAALILGTILGIKYWQPRLKAMQDAVRKSSIEVSAPRPPETLQQEAPPSKAEANEPASPRSPLGSPLAPIIAPAHPAAKAPSGSPDAAANMATPVRPSVLTITAVKEAKLTIRLDENALQEMSFHAGQSQSLSVFREIEIKSSDKSAFAFQYNGKPLEVSGPFIKLFNRYLFTKPR